MASPRTKEARRRESLEATEEAASSSKKARLSIPFLGSFSSPNPHQSIPNLFERTSYGDGHMSLSESSGQETVHPLAEEPRTSPSPSSISSPSPAAPTLSIIDNWSPTTRPASSSSQGGRSLRLASLAADPSDTVLLQWRIIWKNCRTLVLAPHLREQFALAWLTDRLRERISLPRSNNVKPELKIEIKFHLDIGVICDCPDEINDYHSECATSPSRQGDQETGLIIVSKTILSDMGCNDTKLFIQHGDTTEPYNPRRWGTVRWRRDWAKQVKDEMMMQLEECVSIHNVEKAIWLGISVYWDSWDSQNGRGSSGATSFACRDDYTDEFESRAAVEARIVPIL
ncbi:hypothetical protein EDB81DRAFT_768999 [Dactylonectria macrodidyma]|uniref:Uncharacterized protein n=1 Tax=Dactylonectria macrodidyma TaxID=307937 RepID=A0A9P9CYE1_9HYPO|nr:hypothetical protein EDB81DRAFT_768999 [Dactylonectria macrodidyma]